MASTLLTNGYLVTVDPGRMVIPSGWIEIEADSITGIGPMTQVPRRPADQVIDLKGNITLPGLVNGHNHHWASLFKNTGEGLLLEDWIDQIAIPLGTHLTKEDLRVAAYLGAIEQLHTGTTCSLNHLTNINNLDSMRAIIEPALEVGVRQFVTKELRNTPSPPFSNRYPARPHVRDLREELELAENVVDEWDGRGGLIHMGLAIESGAALLIHNSTSNDIILEGLALAKRRGLKITNHCSAGTPWLSIKDFEQMTGGGDIDYLLRLGALTDNWIFAHCLHLKDREIDHLARSGASVVTNPVSNAYSCDGVAPLKQILQSGVNVALGTDGTYVNCSPDMIEQMKFLCLIQNVTHFDPTFLTAETAVEMATLNGARAMGIDHLVGSLEVGKKADIVAFDVDKPHATVANRPVAALVFSAHGTDVDLAIVNGEIRLRDGRLVGFDGEKSVLVEARRRAAEVLARAGLAGRVSQHWRT